MTQRPQGASELIEIVDNGPGFGHVEHVHGMGLKIALRMLTECGGRMQIERHSYDRTLVRMSLPIASRRSRSGGQ